LNRADFSLETWRPGEPDPDAPGAREVRGQRLTGRIVLDNTRFEDCVFQSAVLVYAGGPPPSIRGCTFRNVSFEFAGPAGRTLAFLQALSRRSSGLSDIFKASFPRLFGH
jgi:hypothetical protein